ncbi:MAG: 3-oxoacyl-ACP synthase [Bacteroidota bacterium]|jgi:transcription elongation GreA/GreB family factor|nr:3-oxoacyl-ACP synthase [Bacteroidota bacterium]
MGDKELKEKLYDLCWEYASSRLETLKHAIGDARESANDDSKSSAGDKHETGRAMAQLEQEKLSVQLQEAEKLLKALQMIERGKISSAITSGSVVMTDKGNYFLSISAGKLLIGNEPYFAVSPASPIGAALLNHKEVSSPFNFNGISYRIKKVS